MPIPADPEPSEPATDDIALVRAARDGDRAALGRLYQRHFRVVHGLLLARVPPAEVEDLAHDVFVLAMRNLASLRDPAAFGPWLATIVHNRVVSRHRAQPPRAREVAESDAVAPAPGAAAVEAHTILALIQQLPMAYRETLLLRLVEGMSGPEIAARTGLGADSVRVNLHRGMKKLRALLDARGGGKP